MHFKCPRRYWGLLNRKGGDLLQESESRSVLTQGYISRTGHGALPHCRFLQCVCSTNKLLPRQTCAGFCPDILPTAGHQSSLCFCGCFLEYVFSTPWASATLVTASGLLVTVLGLQEITATHSGCGLLVSRDKLSSCCSWLQPQTATTTLGTPGKFFSRKLTWSTRLQTRVVMGTTNPFSSHSFRKIKAKQVCCGQTSRGHCLLVFEKLPSYRAGLSGQGVTDQLQGWGRESFE